jgi:hypothetical protein
MTGLIRLRDGFANARFTKQPAHDTERVRSAIQRTKGNTVMARKYYTAAVITAEGVEEDFGAFDQSDVDFEVETWRDNGARKKDIFRKTWTKCPSSAQYIEWLNAVRATFTAQ